MLNDTASPTLGLAPRPPANLDPRLYQIAVLGSLLLYGVLALDFEVRPLHAAVTLAAALGTQAALARWTGRPSLDLRSALISALGLCLFLRTSVVGLAAAAAILAIGGKFVLRVRGKHVFNPTNLALVLLLLLSPDVWVSPGQWGSGAILAAAMAGAGSLVVNRATRGDVSFAFLLTYATVLLGRAVWLGDPWSVPLHQLRSGTLMVFTFHMISDPRSTPDSRAGRILFGAAVAVVAATIQLQLFRATAPIWALALVSPLTPVLDRLLPGPRFAWPGPREHAMPRVPRRLAVTSALLLALLAAPALAPPADAFCGFYVAKADTRLFNRASQVVLARHDGKTVITMVNDFKGDPKEFALVVPVPTVLQRGQIHVRDRAVVEHLDAYSAPRLVEYFDPDPCAPQRMRAPSALGAARSDTAKEEQEIRARGLGVTIEARYTVGEYDILILSAQESSGLLTWLRDSGYRLPPGAGPVVQSYLRQGLKFFVARVNLTEQSRLGYSYLRPLQVAFESPRFTLPIRLGMVNADGPQELFVYTLTRQGRVETTNYRTVRLPSGMDLPVHVKAEFPEVYRAMFAEQVRREDMRAVFLEYAWDMSWCDPCAADPLSVEELRSLGVFWLPEPPAGSPPGPAVRPRRPTPSGPVDVFVTRLHVRYDADRFPDDLQLHETADRQSFQARYVLRHAFTGPAPCEAGTRYREELARRQDREAQALASLTGWKVDDIRRRMGPPPAPPVDDRPWWRRLPER